MNSSEQTTVATLAVFFALIFLLIMITMCCILRRGCRKETTQEGHKRYRFRSDWDKSGTMTSSETRITEAFPPSDNTTASTATSDKNNQGNAGVLVRIEEESIVDSCGKIDSMTRQNETVDEADEKREEDGALSQFEKIGDSNGCKSANVGSSSEAEEETTLIEKDDGSSKSTCLCISANLTPKKKPSGKLVVTSKHKNKHSCLTDAADSMSYCSTGESSKELINDSDTAALSEEY